MLDLQAWHDFDVAMLGATAALAGLVIVAASVNIEVIIRAPSLTARLASAIAGLVLPIVVCAIGLMPGLEPVPYGVVTIVAALAAGGFAADAAVRIRQNRNPKNRLRAAKALTGFVAPLLYLVGGVLLVSGDAAGPVWLATGSIAAIIAALAVSWIVLVEVLR